MVDLDGAPDVFVLNTCTVTAEADREARQVIRRVLRRAPHALVVVTGCYAQLKPEEIASIEGVDLVLGSAEKFRPFEFLPTELGKLDAPRIACAPIDDAIAFGPSFSSGTDGRTRAFLKVQDGCDYSCAFCTIPLARGASRSQSIGDSIVQARALVAAGYREIVLTGVNVGDYGSKSGSSLLELLRALEEIDGLARVRISSIEPNLLTDEIIDHCAHSRIVCPHFHIPLQSGSDAVLRGMRRRYATALYRDRVERAIARIPHAAIGVDVIAGFPGETPAHARETYEFLHALPVAYLHVFTYSERDDTPARDFAGRVEPKERKERNAMLRILSAKKRAAFFTAHGGSVRPVLVERIEDGYAEGWTDNYIPVRVPSADVTENSIVNVRVGSTDGEVCAGDVIR